MAGEDDGDQPLDQPANQPAPGQTAVDPKDGERKETKARMVERQRREWLAKQLADPYGREFLWGILAALHTFEERYGFAGDGSVNEPATWGYVAQQDVGLRLYHQWSVMDRAGVLSLLDEFHPQFPKPPKGKGK